MRIVSSRFPLVFLVAALLLGVACRRGSTNDNTEMTEPTTLRVDNRAFNDMTIYALRSSQRIRLGVANGNSTTRFQIPSYLIFGATPLRFLADPIGASGTPVSEEITVQPGDEVVLMIPPV
jgi:hypothetical protein